MAIRITSAARPPCCGIFRRTESGKACPFRRTLVCAICQTRLACRGLVANGAGSDREISGGVEIRVLHPPPPDWERQRVRNEDSIVLDLRLGDVSIVLPGDIGREAEQSAHAADSRPQPITIVKAPHHGSATSSTRGLHHRAAPRRRRLQRRPRQPLWPSRACRRRSLPAASRLVFGPMRTARLCWIRMAGR